MGDKVVCPQCGFEIELTEALSAQLSARLRKEFDAAARKKEQEHRAQLEAMRGEIAADAERKVLETTAVQMKALQEEVAEKGRRLEAAQAAELDLIRQRRELEEERRALEVEAAKKVEAEREEIKNRAFKEAREELLKEVADLREEAAAKDKKLAEARDAELQLIKERQALAEAQEAFELEKARQLEEERDRLREEVKRTIDEQHRLKEAEWNKQREDMSRQIDELRRKAEQGSQQAQGEVQELDLEETLRLEFPFDTIEPVAKGKRGADVLQLVRDHSGHHCGTILWESKRAKHWNNDWLPKLRDDQRGEKAEVAVLVAETLPKEVANFANIEGTWVTNRACAIGVASAMRAGLLEVGMVKRSLSGRQDKMELLYHYLAGSEFRQRIEGIAEAFATMREDLTKERAVMERHWAKREKQLQRAMLSASGLTGDLQGIMGSGMPEIEGLALTALVEDDQPDVEVGKEIE